MEIEKEARGTERGDRETDIDRERDRGQSQQHPEEAHATTNNNVHLETQTTTDNDDGPLANNIPEANRNWEQTDVGRCHKKLKGVEIFEGMGVSSGQKLQILETLRIEEFPETGLYFKPVFQKTEIIERSEAQRDWVNTYTILLRDWRPLELKKCLPSVSLKSQNTTDNSENSLQQSMQHERSGQPNTWKQAENMNKRGERSNTFNTNVMVELGERMGEGIIHDTGQSKAHQTP
ncbi:hypothetical protein J6590_039080 [Homalodisca vitripennis]|nr:hypothetical protein J6590_039080 [Homalodisca vitripennis]